MLRIENACDLQGLDVLRRGGSGESKGCRERNKRA